MNTINLNGKARPFKFGSNAVRVYKKEFARNFFRDIKTIKEEFDFEILIAYAYVGLVEGCRKNKLRVDFSVEDVADWMDEPDGFQEVQKSFKMMDLGNFISDTKKKPLKGVR
jgi:hypothetical protein